MKMNWKDFGAVREERKRRARPFVIAHRGVMHTEPENTLGSFAVALDQGADVLETDLRFSADDGIVLMHDATVDRTTNGAGAVRDLSTRELGQLQVRSPLDNRVTQESVPSLTDLIQLTRGSVPLLLELKDPLFAQEAYARRLAETLAEHNMTELCALVSFRMEHVLSVKRVAPAIPIGMITYTNLMPPAAAELAGPVWPILFANPFFVTIAHRRGSLVAPLDPDPEVRARLYNRMDVDAVLANDPARVLNALG